MICVAILETALALKAKTFTQEYLVYEDKPEAKEMPHMLKASFLGE
ncbi:MAG TPA: hypothetical protein GXX59_07690 [Syntrophomonadaceae bacterium]|nr:hypothetical protein [Syntrophomonadaceae bacterium]